MKRYERIALIAFVLLCAAAFVGVVAMDITDNLWPEGLLIGAGVGAAVLIGAVVRRWEKENGEDAHLFF
ncbi:MAG: hypothetical protein IJO42_00580 [Clostridia bacterium]|nr:hypothetical protein [Clostridia bacterium]